MRIGKDKDTIAENALVEDEAMSTPSQKGSAAPSIASVEESRPTTPVEAGL
jgi:hypothetical protein